VKNPPPKPKYLQISDFWEAEMDAGRLRPGDLMPTKEQLKERHEASLNTIDSALGVLREKGRIESRQGRGTFVIEPPSSPTREDELADLKDRVARLEARMAEVCARIELPYAPTEPASQGAQ
jgi:DNA-binding GntR family transcriptional regulator